MTKQAPPEALSLDEIEHRNNLLMCNIAYRLKQVRLLMWLTHQQAEILCNMKRNTLPRIESGGHHPNLDTVHGIIISYRLPLSYFFQEYTSFPTRAEWKHLEQMNKEVIRYNKSKKRILPQTGTQLQLPF